ILNWNGTFPTSRSYWAQTGETLASNTRLAIVVMIRGDVFIRTPSKSHVRCGEHPRSCVTVTSGQTARMSEECWESMKRQAPRTDVIQRRHTCSRLPTPSGSVRDHGVPLQAFGEDG